MSKTKNQKKENKCNICEKEFDSEFELKRHIEIVGIIH